MKMMHKAVRYALRVFYSPPVAFVYEILQRFQRHHASTYAAALAYYTLFSTVPLLYCVLVIGSFFLDAHEVQQLALDSLTVLLPAAASVIRLNLESILRYRGALTTVAVLGALWSASGMFTALEQAINVVWECPGARKFWKRRLIGILSLLGVTTWVLFAFFSRSLARLLPHVFPWWPVVEAPPLLSSERLLAFAAIFLLNFVLFYFFPARPVRRRAALLISLLTALVWMVTRELFAWALTAGLLSYPLVYGSLWVLLIPLIWAYWSYRLFLLGAEVLAYWESLYASQRACESANQRTSEPAI